MPTKSSDRPYREVFIAARTSMEIADILRVQRDELAVSVLHMNATAAMHAYSDLTDAAVRRVFELAQEDVRSTIPDTGTVRGVAVAAVGGYGRQEMCPFSDVDVAFISESEDDERIDLLVKRAFRLLMDMVDAAQLKVGYSFRRVDDVDNLPLETHTALLDTRIIAGDNYLMSVFLADLRKTVAPCAFVTGHLSSRGVIGSGRRTPYLVSPNIKEGTGALRDIQAIRWISQVAFSLYDMDIWSNLRARGIISDADIVSIEKASEFMFGLRIAMHILANKESDSLGPNMAFQASQTLGYASIDEMMSAYYKHAEVIHEMLLRVSEASLDEQLEIEPGVISIRGFLKVVDADLLVRDNAAIVRLFSHCQQYSLKLHRETRVMVSKRAQDWKIDRNAAKVFLDILSAPGASVCARGMADCGLMQVIVPQFGKLMLLISGDSAHKYTIGEHTLRVMEELEKLISSEGDLYGDILSRLQNLEVLTLAALMHDVGKIDSHKDHAKTGAFAASKFARQLGMDEESAKRVEFLVRHHLRMNEVARLRDLNQIKTIKDFASVVKDQGLLDMLLLLSIADINGVGSRNWNPVQMRFLMELHERASVVIRSPDRPPADIEKHRNRVRRELRLANLPVEEVDEHCDSMPAGYLLNTSPEELALHIGYVMSAKADYPAIDVREDRGVEYTQVTVFTPDKPGLLCDIAGTLAALGLGIHAAQVYTRESPDHIAIDKLLIDFEGRQLTQMKKWQVESELAGVLKGEQTVDAVWARLGKNRKREITGVSVSWTDNVSDHHTVLEIRADDAPGLLHYLTGKIAEHGMNIHSARVATWGHQARDVFYVTDTNGNLMTSESLQQFASKF